MADTVMEQAHRTEVERGERFEFGKNWRHFLEVLSDHRIREAEESLRKALGDLKGKTFLDVGCGSGLFSLAARRLGARVHSFDYDPDSVGCATELRRRYFDGDRDWKIEEGSVLDERYLSMLAKFDVVYSWGVLHHTGAMYQALDNVANLVAPGGQLFIAIYNDQGPATRRWTALKRAYNRAPSALRPLVLLPAAIRLWGPTMVRDLVHGSPLRSWREYIRQRGMSPWHDVIDWVGGYPFEVARPEEIFEFFRERHFALRGLRTMGGGLGCNEFVFVKEA